MITAGKIRSIDRERLAIFYDVPAHVGAIVNIGEEAFLTKFDEMQVGDTIFIHYDGTVQAVDAASGN